MESEPDVSGPLRESTWMLIAAFFVCFGVPVLVGSMVWLGSAIFVNTISELPVTPWGQPSCAFLSASSLASITAAAKSSAQAASFLSSCASFAVIASNDSMSTAASFPLLTKLQKVYPLSQYASYVLPASLREPPSDPVQLNGYVTQHLRPAVMALDALVGPLVKRHFSLIHLPSTSALLIDAWVRGIYQYADALGHQQTATFFDGKTLAQRYPGQRFSVSDVVLSRLVEGTSNGAILRFADVVTAFDPSLLVPKFATLGLGQANSAVLVVNQQGDLGSSENFARLATTLSTYTVKSVNVSYTGTTAKGTFAPSQVQTAVNAINAQLADMALGSGPVKLIVVLNPANYYAAQTAFAAAFDAALASYANNARVVFVSLSFAPHEAVGFPVVRGTATVASRPSDDLKDLGFATDATTLQSQLYKQDLYVLDAAKFAAKCGTMSTGGGLLGVTGNPLKFDAIKGTVISEFMHDDGTIAAGQVLAASETGLRYNGRSSGRPAIPAK